MILKKSHILLLFSFTIILGAVFFIDLFSGESTLSFNQIISSLTDYDELDNSHIIARNFRIPRVVIAFVVGSGLSIAGLLMQTLFNNPLAGPYVLGINAGSSLMVALGSMSGISFFTNGFGLVTNALIGAFIFGLIVLAFSKFVKSQITLLLVGIMLGSFTGAIISLLQSMAELQSLKSFTMWSLGSLDNVEYEELWIVLLVFGIGVLCSFLMVKSLNVFMLGEQKSRLLGLNVKRFRILLILITAVLTGLVTSYCGPIGFVGLAVPNLVRIIFKTQDHRVLIPGCILVGGILLLVCDITIQSLSDHLLMPINVLTALIGAPFIVLLLIKRLG